MEHDLEDTSQTGLLGTEGLLASPKAHLLDLTTRLLLPVTEVVFQRRPFVLSHPPLQHNVDAQPMSQECCCGFSKDGTYRALWLPPGFLGMLALRS